MGIDLNPSRVFQQEMSQILRGPGSAQDFLLEDYPPKTLLEAAGRLGTLGQG